MDDSVREALANDRTIDITTTGRHTGRPRRIEVWIFRHDGRLFLSGAPGRRDWFANLLATPEFTLHLKRSAQADLAARAHPISDDEERREAITGIFEDLGRESTDLDGWVARSPLAEIEIL
jgi:deazaflavin-dependent oxidoreductase (nitroreductase family)